MPGKGTKVDLGAKAPVKQEGAGLVADSVAVESVEKGGKFAENPNIKMSPDDGGGGAGAKAIQVNKTSSNSTSKVVETAPTYVINQYIREPGGPHGKNIKEEPDMTGRPAELNVEPGSKDDPARKAELDLLKSKNEVSGVPGGRREGPSNGQPYGVLDNETAV